MPRIVFVIGACGSGKSSVLARMRPVLAPLVGEVAVLETDTTYQMIDPTWSAQDPAPYADIARRLAVHIASELVHEGFDWVAIGSNGLHDRATVDALMGELPAHAEVSHVALDPSVEVIQQRITARAHPLDAYKTPDWLEAQVASTRGRFEPWTTRIDNGGLDVDETVLAIYTKVRAGEGYLRGPLHTEDQS